jgi:tRNA U34 5-methylaminomethyl-2-thiouridine-forming methyltransferase MnmC
LIKTQDGSYTLYNEVFKQHYHSVKEGALNETLYKHIIPAIEYHKNKTKLNILDICFGLGYNTLATIYYIKKHNLNIKLNIYSPEFDLKLIQSLTKFEYPKELKELSYIIQKLTTDFSYSHNNISIKLYNGDARKYIKTLSNIDIVYQDAFSSDVNKSLWTKEYFSDIYNILSSDAIITTYSISTPIRLSIYENNLHIYEYKSPYTNKLTIALKHKLTKEKENYKYIDMKLKKIRNPNAKSLKD